MNEHIKRAIDALERERSDEAERFISRYGTPEQAPKHLREPLAAEWWDAKAIWNPCDTPREMLGRLLAHRAKYDEAIAYLRGLTSNKSRNRY